jgi:hypothetical protein
MGRNDLSDYRKPQSRTPLLCGIEELKNFEIVRDTDSGISNIQRYEPGELIATDG